MAEIDVLKAFALVWSDLVDVGFDIDQSENVRSSQDRLLALGKAAITPVLSSQDNDFSRHNSTAVFLKQGDEDVAGVLLRLDVLGAGEFAGFLERSLSRQYGVHVELADRSSTCRSAALDDIKGQVLYMGDLYVSPTVRGRRNTLRSFVAAMQILAFHKWKFDWAYAFMRSRDVQLGFAATYGFTRQIHRPLCWSEDVAGRSSDEYLVAVPRMDFESQVSRVFASDVRTQ